MKYGEMNLWYLYLICLHILWLGDTESAFYAVQENHVL